MKRLQPGALVALPILFLASWSAPLAALTLPPGTVAVSPPQLAALVLLALLASGAATRLAFTAPAAGAASRLPASSWRASPSPASPPSAPSSTSPSTSSSAATPRVGSRAAEAAAGAPLVLPAAQALQDLARELRARLDGVMSTSELLVQELQGPHQIALADLMRDGVEELAELASMADELAALSGGGQADSPPPPVCPLNFLQRNVTAVRSAVRSRMSSISLVVAPDLPRQVCLDERLWSRLLSVLLRCLSRIQDRAVLIVSAERHGEAQLRLRLSSAAHATAGAGVAMAAPAPVPAGVGVAGNEQMLLAGLGLLLPARLAHAMGGRLSVERAGESGASLELLLPVSAVSRRSTPVWEAW